MRIEDDSTIFPPTGRDHSRRVAPLLVALVILVSTCSCQGQHGPLPDLQLHGTTQIPGLTDLQRKGADDLIDYIDSVAAYAPSGGPGGARILFQVTQYGGASIYMPLYDVGLDGRGLRSIPLRQPCDGPVTVSHDGRWAACQDQMGIEVTALDVVRPGGGRQVLAGAVPDDLESPTWSPDGEHLAVITRNLGGGCAIAIYDGRPPYAALHMTTLLTFSGIPYPGTPAPACSLTPSKLAWSPDGAWLALEDARDQDVPTTPVYALRLPPATGSAASGAPFATIALTPSQPVPLGIPGFRAPPTWSVTGNGPTLTYVGTTWRSVVQVDLATRRQTTLIDFSAASVGGTICALSWTPGGHELVFVHCAPGGLDVAAAPSKVYYYTPGSG